MKNKAERNHPLLGEEEEEGEEEICSFYDRSYHFKQREKEIKIKRERNQPNRHLLSIQSLKKLHMQR